VVEELRQPFMVNDTGLHAGCSIGITVYPDDGRDAVSLLKNADAAMYEETRLIIPIGEWVVRAALKQFSQ
jgi:GGDEF domain-containing protein